MALTTAQFRRGGANGGVTDADGRAFITDAGGIGDTVSAQGTTVAAPASNTVIATLAAASLPAGVYKVELTTVQSGTVDANAINANFRKTAVFVGVAATTATPTVSRYDRVTLDGATTLNLAVGGTAGGAGAVYNGIIRATRIE